MTNTEDIQRREDLRARELQRLGELYARIEAGMNEGRIEELAGAKMLLNISQARLSLGGVGVYPGAF
jgi:hypothetical protein